MRSFDGKKDWIENYCFKPRDRLNLYHTITSYIDESDDRLCKISKRVFNRIGSESQNGEVFIGNIDNKEFAIKILPIIGMNSYSKNKNEIIISETEDRKNELNGLTPDSTLVSTGKD